MRGAGLSSILLPLPEGSCAVSPQGGGFDLIASVKLKFLIHPHRRCSGGNFGVPSGTFGHLLCQRTLPKFPFFLSVVQDLCLQGL